MNARVLSPYAQFFAKAMVLLAALVLALQDRLTAPVAEVMTGALFALGVSNAATIMSAVRGAGSLLHPPAAPPVAPPAVPPSVAPTSTMALMSRSLALACMFAIAIAFGVAFACTPAERQTERVVAGDILRYECMRVEDAGAAVSGAVELAKEVAAELRKPHDAGEGGAP